VLQRSVELTARSSPSCKCFVRVIGLFNMASLGLRAFSGISVGLLGSLIGIHWSLALSALATMIVAGGLLAVQ